MSIYLDYNATTPVDAAVCEIICSTLSKSWGNPSSSYNYGKDAHTIIEEARQKTAKMVRCFSDEIIFTSGGTESNNMVIHSAIKSFYMKKESNGNANNCNYKPHIITTNIEHDSVKLPLEKLNSSGKADVTFVPVSKVTGAVDVKDIVGSIRNTTCLITVMLANNETGVIQPIKEISKAVKMLQSNTSSQILLHSDAAQAIGKILVDVQDLGVDYLTIVGHKFYGPRIGALYFKRNIPLSPIFYGGGQERNYRPGTENTCMIAGLGKAAELVDLNLEAYSKNMLKLRCYFEECLKEEFSDKVIFNVRSDVDRLPNTLSVAFDFDTITGHELLAEAKDICASTGAACHSGGKPSAVLLASGIPEWLTAKTLRLSLGRETTMSDIEDAVISLKKAVKKLCVW